MALPQERVRYSDTIDPIVTDGRDLDTSIATLGGEAAEQQVLHEDERLSEIASTVWSQMPPTTGTDLTYYDRPMLKESVWSAEIPIYFFLGGTAEAALALGAAVQLMYRPVRRDVRPLSKLCQWIGIIGSTAGAAFLIHDLGRPARFLYMMRVFRPTSPMNMGVWILSGAAPTAILTVLFLNRGGWLGKIGRWSGYVSGIFGAALAGYTGVLVANTAIPIWQQSGR